MRYMNLLILALALSASTLSARDIFWTFGPMAHYHFGPLKSRMSYGFEISAWSPVGIWDPAFAEDGEDPFVGLDLGIERQSAITRVYSEAQYSFIGPTAYVGLSSGPFLEFGRGKDVGYGIQGSTWLAAGLGADLRFRLGTGGADIMPGLFAKAVLPTSGD